MFFTWSFLIKGITFMDSKPIFDEIFQRVSKGNIISPRGSKVIEVEKSNH